MSLTASRRLVPELIELDSVPSTNPELIARAADPGLPGYTTLVTRDQTAGRGRLDRVWTAPRGTALAISVLVRLRDRTGEPLAPERLGWLPIAAGLAMSATVAELIPTRTVGLKWPNDVLVSAPAGGVPTRGDGPERKICGVLGELLPSGSGAVIGAGLNLAMTAEQLPVPTATSLLVEGALPDAGPAAVDALADRALAGYLRRLILLCDAYAYAGGDADRSGLRNAARAACVTLGREVRVESPGAQPVRARAADLDEHGRLLVQPIAADGSLGEHTPISAGDITHLRHG